MTLSVMPPAMEHYEDPNWYNQAGFDPLDSKKIFRMETGPDHRARLESIVKEYPKYGPKMYERAAELGRADVIELLLELGAEMYIEEIKGEDESEDDSDNESDDEDMEDEEGVGSGNEDDTMSEDGISDQEGADDGDDNDSEMDSQEGNSASEDEDFGPLVDMQPAIHVSAFEGHLDCVKVLVEKGNIPVNLKDSNSTTALTNAAVQGHTSIVECLINHGAELVLDTDRKAEKKGGLQAAIDSGDISLVKLILESEQGRKQSLSIKFSDLAYAALSGSEDMVKFVLERAGVPIPQSKKERGRLGAEKRGVVITSIAVATGKGALEPILLILSYITTPSSDETFEYVELREIDRNNFFKATEDCLDEADIPKVFELIWDNFLTPPAVVLDTNATVKNIETIGCNAVSYPPQQTAYWRRQSSYAKSMARISTISVPDTLQHHWDAPPALARSSYLEDWKSHGI
jgi:hypothetical protein